MWFSINYVILKQKKNNRIATKLSQRGTSERASTPPPCKLFRGLRTPRSRCWWPAINRIMARKWHPTGGFFPMTLQGLWPLYGQRMVSVSLVSPRENVEWNYVKGNILLSVAARRLPFRVRLSPLSLAPPRFLSPFFQPNRQALKVTNALTHACHRYSHWFSSLSLASSPVVFASFRLSSQWFPKWVTPPPAGRCWSRLQPEKCNSKHLYARSCEATASETQSILILFFRKISNIVLKCQKYLFWKTSEWKEKKNTVICNIYAMISVMEELKSELLTFSIYQLPTTMLDYYKSKIRVVRFFPANW